jgi:hypothetical protein
MDEATPQELKFYASTFLGLPTDNKTPAEITAMVRAANEGTDIWVAQAAEETSAQVGSPPPAPVTSGKLQGGRGSEDPRVRLTLHAEERDGVVISRHKEVAVNGYPWLLKRGESIEVPYRVYLALNAAERDAMTHDSEGTEVHQKVKNVPFNIERLPSQEEIDAWHARTDSQFAPA